MPTQVSYPGVYIEEIPSGVRTITGVANSIALFLGWAAKGATDRAVLLNSFAAFEREFGGLDSRSFLGYSVRHFFDNGGSDAYVIRLSAAGDDVTEGEEPAEGGEPAVVASVLIPGGLTVSASSAGDWANSYSIRTVRRPAPDVTRFRLEVLDSNNVIVETFVNLSMQETDSRFPPNIINGRSQFIHVEATNATNAPLDGSAPLPLSGGEDGSVLEPNDAEFDRAVLARFGTGSITDQIDLFNIVCVPGETNPATIATIQGHCRRHRAFLLVDSPPGQTVAGMRSNGTTNMTGSDSLNSALYFPWVRQPDPLQAGAVREFPPCGFVAGIYARTDTSRGVWKAPAGSEASLNGAVGLAYPASDAENGQLNPLAINCLRTLPVFGNVVWGSRTLHGQNDRGSEWKYIPVRRTALFIEESLFRGTQWVIFEPNDEPLWRQIRLNVGSFMHNLFRQGAFQGQTPKEAYFVKCDKETTTQNDINLGILNIFVGFAPLKPAEFVIIKLQQMAGELTT